MIVRMMAGPIVHITVLVQGPGVASGVGEVLSVFEGDNCTRVSYTC